MASLNRKAPLRTSHGTHDAVLNHYPRNITFCAHRVSFNAFRDGRDDGEKGDEGYDG